jgi:trigger factor
LLKVQTTPPENCEVLLTVEVDEKQADRIMKSAARRIARQVQIRGFRPGKAPYNVVLRLVGEEAIQNEALEELSQSVFQDALKEAGIEPSAPASMEDITWSPIVMRVRVPVDPVVELDDYRSLRLEQPPVEVTEAEVDEALVKLQEEYTVYNEVERAAELGDRVTMDVQELDGDEVLGEEDDVPFNLVERDEESTFPDTVTPLLGISAGEERSFELTYPEDFKDERYAGKEITISVKAHKVEEKIAYPLDDDFAQTVGDYDDLAALRAKLAEDLRQRKQTEADRELADKALDEIVENATRVEWHKSAEDAMLERQMEDQDEQLRSSGFGLDMYLETQKKTREEWQEELRPDIRKQLRRRLVIEELAEKEGLTLAGDELLEHIEMLSTMAGEQGSAVRRYLMAPGNVDRVASDFLMGKVRDRVVQIVKGEAENDEAAEASDSAEEGASAGSTLSEEPESE